MKMSAVTRQNIDGRNRNASRVYNLGNNDTGEERSRTLSVIPRSKAAGEINTCLKAQFYGDK